MNIVLDVAFIVAATAFFKEQLELSGKLALLCAFIVALVVGLAPVLAATLPTAAPFIEATMNVVMLFVAAAGSYDAIQSFRAPKLE